MGKELRSYVTFYSEAFNRKEPRDYFINPCCFGDDFCKWFMDKLRAKGLVCDAEPGQEDFGWYFGFEHNGLNYCLVCGSFEDDDLSYNWFFSLEKEAGFIASLFGARNKGLSPEVLDLLQEVLSSSPEISNIAWHYRHDFDRGNTESGLAQPNP